MAISRMQLPEEIDAFANGGDISSTPNSAFADLGAQMMQPNYEESLEKYKNRLASMAPQRKKMSVYDLASELGRGLLQTPNTGGASAFTGLGVGFNNVSEKIKADEDMYAKENREVQMMAMNLAMKDEQQAKDYLNQIALKRIDAVNKDVDYTVLEYDEIVGGQTVTTRVRKPQTTAGNIEIDDIYATKQNVREVKPATTQINMPGINDQDKEALKQIYKNQTVFSEKAQASNATLDQVDEARFLAEEVGPQNFGPLSRSTLKLREFMSGMGWDDLLEDPGIIAPQKALNQLSMGFTMGIVSQTKGAISNKEMQLFIDASPTLGSTYPGYLKQLELLERLASRDSDFYKAYINKQKELNAGDLSLYEQQLELETLTATWKRENPLFTKEERASLEDMIAGGDGGFEGAGIDPDFDPQGYQAKINSRKMDQSSKITTNVEGVPDGSTFVMELNGAKYYLKPGGNVNNKEDLIKVSKAE